MDEWRSQRLSNLDVEKELSTYVSPGGLATDPERIANQEEKDLLQTSLEGLGLLALPPQAPLKGKSDGASQLPDGKEKTATPEPTLPKTDLSASPTDHSSEQKELKKQKENKDNKEAALVISPKALLLLGRGGSGKSTFGRHLERQVWKQYRIGGYIPVFIPLTTVKRFDSNLVSDHLQALGFNARHIEEMKKPDEKGQYTYRFFFILDGYDEVNIKVNLYEKAELSQWPDAKLVISCRPEYLSPNYRHWFQPSSKGTQSQSDFLVERWMAPFPG